MPSRRSSTNDWRPSVLKGISFLALIACACAGLLVATERSTTERILLNKQHYELKQISDLIGHVPAAPPQWHDDTWLLCDGTTLVRAQRQGYGGIIHAVAAHRQHRLVGIRVSGHQETPGIADFVVLPEHPWRAGLRGRSANELTGIDAVSGATITSRALIALAKEALGTPAVAKACSS